MRLVLDTDVVVAGLRSRTGASRLLLDAGFAGRFKPLLSPALCFEYEQVLVRPGNLAASGLTRAEIARFLVGFLSKAERLTIYFTWRPAAGDPDDDHLIDLAVAGRADAIVTFNRRDVAAARRHGIQVWLPGEALAVLRERGDLS